MLKKISSVLFIVFLLVLLIPIPVKASGTVNLVLNPSNSSVTVGNNFTVTIQVQAGSTGVSAVGASLVFDQSKVNVVSISGGGSLPFVFTNTYNNSAGTLRYDAGKIGEPYPSGTFTHATITFHTLAVTASTAISFTSIGVDTGVIDDTGENEVLNTASDTSVAIIGASVPPTITTDAASDIGINNATLSGTLVDMGTPTQSSVSISFQIGTTTSYGWTTTAQVLSSPGVFNTTVAGLAPNTVYHFRARAAGGSAGIGYSSDRTFVTVAYVSPIITISPATSVMETTATLNGNLTSLGMAAATNVYFEYGLTTNYGSNTVIQVMNATGNFTQDVTELTQGKTYHFRAVANYETYSYAYSNDGTFTTAGIPSITSENAVHITSSTATLQGSINSIGSYTPVFGYFEYGPNTDLRSFTVEQTIWNATSVSQTVEELTTNTTYYFRFCVRYNISMRAYGAVLSFTDLAPIIPTPFLPDIPENIPEMYTEGDFSKIPGSSIVNKILDDSDIPRMLWWFPFIYFGICVIGFITYGATKINGAPGSVFLMVIVMEIFIAIPAVMGATPLFPAFLFPLPALAFTVKQNQFTWG